MTTRRFRKCFDLAEIPNEWQLVRFTLDWDGRPLLLFVEGKPTTPDFHTDPEAWSRWYRTPPKAHHLVYWETGERRTIQFEQSQGLSTFHVQRFDGGWLLGERRGGQTTIYDAQGGTRFELNLGDASEDLQTTPQGLIWVSYFDEGVYGGSIGRQGLVCFDNAGTPLFKYADFAEQNALPMISDCYAMNVDQTGAVWLNYYTDFPLIRLHNFAIEKIWKDFGVLGNGFAVRGDEVIHMRDNKLVASSLLSTTLYELTDANVEDENGRVLVPTSQHYADVAARGASLFINTGQALYELLD